MRIEVKELTKQFEHTLVLDRINLEIREKEFLGLLGPSGSGKTTLLRIIAGLEFADGGVVEADGRDVSTLGFEERKFGFVFQHYALFNHMTVFENVAFGMKVRPRGARPDKQAITDRVKELLELVQLGEFEDRFPAQLSGGQRQRVALARTLTIDPQVLLLDEPFGALDAKVRVELRRSLRNIHDATGLTTIFVTHDQEEALDLADRVAIMNHGVIEQIGAPVEVYEFAEDALHFRFSRSYQLLRLRDPPRQGATGRQRAKGGTWHSRRPGCCLRTAARYRAVAAQRSRANARCQAAGHRYNSLCFRAGAAGGGRAAL